MNATDHPEMGASANTIAARAANEGIPLGAIARILQQPFEVIAQTVRSAHSVGAVGNIPKPDWPPGQSSDARLPTTYRTLNQDDMEFGCKQQFRLTNLEAAFMTVLLRFPCAEKEKLHAVIEQQRLTRPFQPDKLEQTDPKMVDVIICHMRKKFRKARLGDNAILTSHGRGYYVDPTMKETIYKMIGVPHYAHLGDAYTGGERASLSAASA